MIFDRMCSVWMSGNADGYRVERHSCSIDGTTSWILDPGPDFEAGKNILRTCFTTICPGCVLS